MVIKIPVSHQIMLTLNLKNILPGFLSANVAKVLVEQFGIAGIQTADEDIQLFCN